MMNNAATQSGERNAAWQPGEPARRIYYFDWLRAIAVFGVVVYHSFLPFAGKWLISNEETSDLLNAVARLFETFGLGVLFLIAGAGARFSLQHRSVRAFLVERAKRLLIPFAVGSVVLVPPIYYILGRHDGTLSLSFPEFLLAYPVIAWTYITTQVGLSPALLIWIGMHLWFLAYLFLCSFLGLPVFAFFSSSLGRSFMDALARLTRWRGVSLLWAVPITLTRIILAASSTGEIAWGVDVFAWYALAFILGYLLYADDRFIAAVRRDFSLALIVAMIGSAALLAAGYSQWVMLPKTYSMMYLFMMSLVGVTGWAWTVTILSWGMRADWMQRRLSVGIGEAALPMYVLHYPILFGIADLVIQSPLNLEAKVLVNEVLVVGTSLLVTLIVLRISILRPLLGLRSPAPVTVSDRLEPGRDAPPAADRAVTWRN